MAQMFSSVSMTRASASGTASPTAAAAALRNPGRRALTLAEK